MSLCQRNFSFIAIFQTIAKTIRFSFKKQKDMFTKVEKTKNRFPQILLVCYPISDLWKIKKFEPFCLFLHLKCLAIYCSLVWFRSYIFVYLVYIYIIYNIYNIYIIYMYIYIGIYILFGFIWIYIYIYMYVYLGMYIYIYSINL